MSTGTSQNREQCNTYFENKLMDLLIMTIIYYCDHSIGNGSWTTAGITTDNVITQSTTSGFSRTVSCRSTHLTSFAVLVNLFTCSTSPVTTSSVQPETEITGMKN